MRSGKAFWGLIILIVGVALLLEPLGILPPGTSVWRFIWPAVLIFLGVWLLVVPLAYRGRKPDTESISIPLGGAADARLRLKHGAGQLSVSSLDSADAFVSGSFGGGVDQIVHMDGGTLRVKLQSPQDNFPVGVPFEGLNWDVKINHGIPVRLDVSSGASETRLDLEDLKLSELNIDTGASSTMVDLPAKAGYTRVHVESGAAAVILRVPAQVAARIQVESGLAGISVDQGRFPRSGSYYESVDYALAANKVDIFVKTGVGSLEVH
jgi:hypothetical protein